MRYFQQDVIDWFLCASTVTKKKLTQRAAENSQRATEIFTIFTLNFDF